MNHNDHIKNVVYCSKTGKPYTVEFDDKLAIGMHRKGTQVTLPLGIEEWQTLSMPNFVQLIFTDPAQIDTLISKLEYLKSMDNNYNQPNQRVIL